MFHVNSYKTCSFSRIRRPQLVFVTSICLYSICLFYVLAMPVAVRTGLSFKELVESRDEERALAELAARHREGTDSFHLKKMMELAFTGALLLFCCCCGNDTATSLTAQGSLLAWQPNFMNPDMNLSITFSTIIIRCKAHKNPVNCDCFSTYLLSSWVSVSWRLILVILRKHVTCFCFWYIVMKIPLFNVLWCAFM